MKKFLNIIFNNFYFCLFYIFTSFSFVTCFKEIPHINVLTKVAICWGFIIAIYNLYSIFKRKPNIIELALFIFLVSTLFLNIFVYRSNENLKIWFVDFIILTSFLFINKEKTKDVLNKELLVISNFYVILTTILSFSSLILLVTHKSFILNDIVYGNSDGLFTNENTLGISAALSVIISLYLFISTKNKTLKGVYSLIVIIQLLSDILSTSRSSALIFIALIFIFILLKIKNYIFRFLLIIVPSVGLGLISLLNEDIVFKFTSGRNELWTSAFVVIKEHFILGIGNSYLVQAVSEARYIYLPGIDLGGLHNIYIQILTTNGFIGFITFISLIAICLYFIIKKIDTTILNLTNKYYVLLALICGILAVNLFESSIMYVVSFISIILWSYLGYTLSLIYCDKLNS